MTALEILFREYAMLLEYQLKVDTTPVRGANTNYDVKLQSRLEYLRSKIDAIVEAELKNEKPN